MTIRVYLPIDGSVTSKEFGDMFARMDVSPAARMVTDPLVSRAVIDAQIGQGLSQFAGLAQVAMDAAPQTVTNAVSTDRGAALS